MIASDTSTWIAFLEGKSGEDVEMIEIRPGRLAAAFQPHKPRATRRMTGRSFEISSAAH